MFYKPKKVFLNKFREEVIKEYEFMNFVEINSENYIICSNFNIKTEENINDANFEIFDLDGNSKKIEKSNFIKSTEDPYTPCNIYTLPL